MVAHALDLAPRLVFYETTRACTLACAHCRACAQPEPHPNQLNSVSAHALIDQIATFPSKPLLILTGGDPLMRPDLFHLVEHARALQLPVALSPATSKRLDRVMMQRIKEAGVACISVSLDGSDAPTHDGLRNIPGCFDATVNVLHTAHELGLRVQVNTTLTHRNAHQINAMANLIERTGAGTWSVFWLVPVGRACKEPRLQGDELIRAMQKLRDESLVRPFAIKTTEAPFYRRFISEHGGKAHPRVAQHGVGINDGRGVLFVSHTGNIYPSGFLPIDCGRFPEVSVVDTYQHHPTFTALRDPQQLKGKCNACGFNRLCGGSRARAKAVTGSAFAADPDCPFKPADYAPIAPQQSQHPHPPLHPQHPA